MSPVNGYHRIRTNERAVDTTRANIIVGNDVTITFDIDGFGEMQCLFFAGCRAEFASLTLLNIDFNPSPHFPFLCRSFFSIRIHGHCFSDQACKFRSLSRVILCGLSYYHMIKISPGRDVSEATMVSTEISRLQLKLLQ